MRAKPVTMFLACASWISKKSPSSATLEDQLLDVIGLVRIVGDQRVERHVDPVGIVEARQRRRPLEIGGRQEVDQPAHLQQRLDVVVVGAVGDRGAGGVDLRAAEFLGGHRLVGHRLHHVRAGDEHVARVAHHEDEVGHRRRIDVAAGARPHDQRNLRDDAGREHVALEHLAIAAERRDALLDARAAGVEQADDRRAVLDRHVLDLGDLLRVRLAERAAEHGEILGENIDRAAVDGAPAGDHAVARNLGLPPCRSRRSGAGRTCRTPRTSRGRAGVRCARARSACPWRAGPRCAARRRRGGRGRGGRRGGRGCLSSGEGFRWKACPTPPSMAGRSMAGTQAERAAVRRFESTVYCRRGR